MASGHNKLKIVVSEIMSDAGFDGYYTNLSLRATTATRLFRANIPEQLIMEQTVHRSYAMFVYKRSSDEQKAKVSPVLQLQRPQPVVVESSSISEVVEPSSVSEGVKRKQNKKSRTFDLEYLKRNTSI